MRVYVEVSKNHNIPFLEVVKGQFRPEIRILIMYYNYMFRLEQQEYERMEREMKKDMNS